ncbi:MAG: hypothetical protein CMH54_05895 [Myxococcales bacterium]|nr:hypothetical protein [Myxococcales bacterium]
MYSYAGCCDGNKVTWCDSVSNVLCQLDCPTWNAASGEIFCAWDQGNGAYDCADAPSADPTGINPLTCPASTNGSCMGNCGGSAGSCYCDSLCFNLGDCCTDICTYCAADNPTNCGTAADCNGTEAWIGDDMCDSGNNNVGCSWDGGDCCESTNPACATSFSYPCDCKDPAACENNPANCAGCVPDCAGKECGADGCGSVCGDCAGGLVCDLNLFECVVSCTPNCQGKECGADGCGSTCGECGTGETCDLNNFICVPGCEPSCDGLACGSDGCGGTCGVCGEGEVCDSGVCTAGECSGYPSWIDDGYCDSANNNVFCSWDGGDCCESSNESCATSPTYPCDCQDPDACENNPANCAACVPNCDGLNCGDDGCGGSCGNCVDAQVCSDGVCGPIVCEGNESWIDDDYCDTSNNNEGCAWDGGDCCLSTNPVCDDNLFSVCDCQDPDACENNPANCGSTCEPDCTGLQCGDDGCGGSCGTCDAGQSCDSGVCVSGGTCGGNEIWIGDGYCDNGNNNLECSWDGGDCCPSTNESCATAFAFPCICLDPDACENNPANCTSGCVPNCAGKECGEDGCGGSCGSCVFGETCSATGQCEAGSGCTPDCQGKNCGADGCGGSCGSCGAGEQCQNGVCSNAGGCMPDCAEKECGDDGCGGSCGYCGLQKICGADFTCEDCITTCDGKECGDDGCGGQCGYCDAGETCSTFGFCIQEGCQPYCPNKNCGDDGCGGLCGQCSDGFVCDTELGQCTVDNGGGNDTGSSGSDAGTTPEDTGPLNSGDGWSNFCPEGKVPLYGECVYPSGNTPGASGGAGTSSGCSASHTSQGHWFMLLVPLALMLGYRRREDPFLGRS